MKMRRVIGIAVVVIAVLFAWSYASTGEVSAPTAGGETPTEYPAELRGVARADVAWGSPSPALTAESPSPPAERALDDRTLPRDQPTPSADPAAEARVDRHQAWVKSEVQPLSMLRTEVTTSAVKACLAAGACSLEDFGGDEPCNVGKVGRDDHPANCVTLAGARRFCAWRGGRLPTLSEWRAEATDGGQRRFPWGDALPTCEHARILEECSFEDTTPVCSRSRGDSRSGLCDLAGGVAEWTAPNRKGEARVMGDIFSLMFGTPLPTSPTEKAPEVGFRCVRDEPGP